MPVCLSSSINQLTTLLMLDTFKIQKVSLTTDSTGGQTQTWSDDVTGIPGYIESSRFRSNEVLHGGHQQEERMWTISLRQGTVVDAAHRLVQTHSNGVAITNRIFKILSVVDGETIDISTDCECIELPGIS